MKKQNQLKLVIGFFPAITFADAAIVIYNGHSYQGIESAMTWEEGKNYCLSKGGHLVTITSPEENDFVWQNVAIKSSWAVTWIGGWDLGNDNWTWVTGEDFAYTNWNLGEPNDSGDAMQMLTSTGTWDDYCGANETSWACSSPISEGFICEWEYANASDLTVTNISLNPISPTVNTSFTAQVTVKNQGEVASDAGKLTLWTNKASVQACNAAGNKTMKVGVLDSGASTTLTFTGLKVAPAGPKTLRAFVDSSCKIFEADETNNQLTLNYRVHPVGAPKLPDFIVSSVALDPSAPMVNGTFTATVKVTNQGNKTGDAGYLDLWADAPSVQTCGTDGDQWVDLGSVSAGATKTVQVTLPAGDTAGAKTLRAFVDSWCETTESDDSNNQFTQSYTVIEIPTP